MQVLEMAVNIAEIVFYAAVVIWIAGRWKK